MATDKDARKRLEDRLRGGEALPGGAGGALPSGAFAERLAAQKDALVYVIGEYDVTGSMDRYISIQPVPQFIKYKY